MNFLLNSDDCGLNIEATDAIISALKAGKINSTSLMLGAEATDYAVQELLTLPDIFIGIHLNLLEGKAVCEPKKIPDLVDNDGYFKLTLMRLWLKTNYSKNLREQIFHEFSAQIELFKKLFPNREIRLDGHLHVHAIPSLSNVMKQIFERFDITYVRIPYEMNFKYKQPTLPKLKSDMRRLLLNSWAKELKSLAKAYKIQTADYFIGSTLSTEMNMDFLILALNYLSDLNYIPEKISKNKLVEIMFHLSFNKYEKSDNDWYKNDYRYAHFSSGRVLEYEMVFSDNFEKLIKKYSSK